MEKKYPTLLQTLLIGLFIIWAGAVWKYDFEFEHNTWKCNSVDANGVTSLDANCEGFAVTIKS